MSDQTPKIRVNQKLAKDFEKILEQAFVILEKQEPLHEYDVTFLKKILSALRKLDDLQNICFEAFRTYKEQI